MENHPAPLTPLWWAGVAANLFVASLSVAETLGLGARAAKACQTGVDAWVTGTFNLVKCCEGVRSWLQGAQRLEQNGKARNVNDMETQVNKLEKQVAEAQLRAAQAENQRQNLTLITLYLTLSQP